MSRRIQCFTLFDITRTGVLNRAKPPINEDYATWFQKRNTQCNLDTILQVISLRTQPDFISDPNVINIPKNHLFGDSYNKEIDDSKCWTFDFTVYHPSVFDDEQEFGYLYKDCQDIPMLLNGTECNGLVSFLDTTKNYKNIYFVKY